MCNKSLVVERVKECLAVAEARFNTTFLMPKIRFDKRGTTAGTANKTQWELNFNMVLLNENTEHFVRQTVAHEFAHLMDHQLFSSKESRFDRWGKRKKRSPHGHNWKNCMLVLGVPATRCHSMDVTNSRVGGRRKTASFDYRCGGCNQTFPMGKIRHNKQQSGKASYHHCRGHELTFVA